ncbi:hypothetical protein D8B34_07090 [Verminephrobacter eiseniae]|nr:hypothetical protein [Verminephrobacter eiseniae]MCW8185368.1 hypothetical protein [Verminephrobacter eiseniae]MCW8223981.1 hypothetical protein [Verminephrobacter eiseniae]MCW8233558.1 hypothetical protein [Verminephrobacter eiseniae]
MSRHGSDVVGCAQPSERSTRRIACPYRAVLASDATPRCASMASADRQMIGDATRGHASHPRAGSPHDQSLPRWPGLAHRLRHPARYGPAHHHRRRARCAPATGRPGMAQRPTAPRWVGCAGYWGFHQ